MHDSPASRSRNAPLRVGVIGCGTIGYWRHLRHLKFLPGTVVEGIVEPDPEHRARALSLVDAHAYLSPEELIHSEEIDAVVLATPTRLHLSQLRECIEAGKHVYCEKPLACGALEEISAPPVTPFGLCVAIGFNYRFHPGCLTLRASLRDGVIGRPTAVVSHFSEPIAQEPGWRSSPTTGGGVLCDLASHHVDLYRWLLQEEFEHLVADARSGRTELEVATLRGRTVGGIDLVGYFSYKSGRSQHIIVHGSDGVLALDVHAGTVHAERASPRGYGVLRRSVVGSLSDYGWRFLKRFRGSYDPSFRRSLAAFRDGATNPARRHPDLATLDDGIAAWRAILMRDQRDSRGNNSTITGLPAA